MWRSFLCFAHGLTMTDSLIWTYLFEAKGIQRHIFDSGRLPDLIGGSDLIAGLCRSDDHDHGLIGDVAAAAGVNLGFSRCAGGAFCAHADSEEAAADLRALWRLAVGLRHPGLEFTDSPPTATQSDAEAVPAARAQMFPLRENAGAAILPLGHPFAAFSPRTGRLAVAPPPQPDEAPLDAVNRPQRLHGKALAHGRVRDRLAEMLAPYGPEGDSLLFPRHFDALEADLHNPAFPFAAGDERVAVVHADISGLGEIYGGLNASGAGAQDCFGVSRAIEMAVADALRDASLAVLLPHAPGIAGPSSIKSFLDGLPSEVVRLKALDRERRAFKRLFGADSEHPDAAFDGVRVMPARPVVAGGDDVTVIVRADLALDFAAALLAAIECRTRDAFVGPLARHGLPALSACAGVAVVAAGHPVMAGTTMAEGLCKRAKSVGKAASPYRSALAFAVVTSNEEESEKRHRAREQVTPAGEAMTLSAILVGAPQPDAPEYGDFRTLASGLARTPGKGKLYDGLRLRWDGDFARAQTEWVRFWEYLDGEDPEAAEGLRKALLACVPRTASELPALSEALAPVSDALDFADIARPIFLADSRA
jgi:hypothetical protein